MNKNYSIQTFQSLLQKFFLQRMIQQRKVSGETINSYRDTFKIYFIYLNECHKIAAESCKIEHIDRDYILKFCYYLEVKRKNKPVTINNRLAAIRSFLQYVAEIAPEYSAIVSRSLAIPFQKQEIPTMNFITKKEFEAMIDCCDTSLFIGARDKLMLMILYNTGIRVAELLELKGSDIKDLDIASQTCIKVYGKGRKERIVPLWKSTAIYIKKYNNINKITNNDRLFKSNKGETLTRSGIRFRINKLVKMASFYEPTLLDKKISVHTFRHAVAMNLLESGVDISTIAIWLGHSSIETTHKYMIANLEMKRKAMNKSGFSGNSSYKYKPSTDILAFLNTL